MILVMSGCDDTYLDLEDDPTGRTVADLFEELIERQRQRTAETGNGTAHGERTK
jgi:hypothetical protein